MKDNTVLVIHIIGQVLLALVCFCGGIYMLINHPDRAGWGWLLFIGVVIGAMSMKSKSDE